MGRAQSEDGPSQCFMFVHDGRKVPINDGLSFTGDESSKSFLQQSIEKNQMLHHSCSLDTSMTTKPTEVSVHAIDGNNSKVSPVRKSILYTNSENETQTEQVRSANAEPVYPNIRIPPKRDKKKSSSRNEYELQPFHSAPFGNNSFVVPNCEQYGTAPNVESKNDPLTTTYDQPPTLDPYDSPPEAAADPQHQFLDDAAAPNLEMHGGGGDDAAHSPDTVGAAWSSTCSESAYETIRSKDRRLDEAVASSFEFYCTASRDARAIGYVSSEVVRIRTGKNTHSHTHRRTHKNNYTYTPAHTHTHLYIYKYIYVYVETYFG